MEWSTSTRILERLRASATGSTWDWFLGWFRTAVVSMARSMGLRAPDAEDVAQETLMAFTKGFRGGQYHRSRGRLSKWLFGIAMRQVRNARRRVARREVLIPARDSASFWSVLPDKTSGGALQEGEGPQAVLESCLARVRSEVQSTTFQAFRMIVYDERTPVETSVALGITVKAVYNAKHRVLRRVRELIRAHDDPQAREAERELS